MSGPSVAVAARRADLAHGGGGLSTACVAIRTWTTVANRARVRIKGIKRPHKKMREEKLRREVTKRIQLKYRCDKYNDNRGSGDGYLLDNPDIRGTKKRSFRSHVCISLQGTSALPSLSQCMQRNNQCRQQKIWRERIKGVKEKHG